ncbi:MAG: hypothetical protein U1F15_01470 [Burkholderiales bacterium]
MADVRALHERARLALQAGDIKGALDHCRTGLALAPADFGLLTTLGHVLRSAGAFAAAVEAFGVAAQAAPGDPVAWMALGNACMEAELALVHAARTRTAAAPDNLLEHAMDAFARAATLAPGDVESHAHLAMAARYACAWPRAEPALRTLAQRFAADPARFRCSPMTAVALLDDAQAQRAAIAGWSAEHMPAPAAPPEGSPRTALRAAPPGGREPWGGPAALIKHRGTPLRVGYLSTDFHDHATAHLAAGLFERHDRARVESFAYACDADDGSAMRRRLLGAFDHWRDVRDATDDAAARLIAGDALDVLVDLKGHTHGSRIDILARRPAPVQLHYLGFPGTIAYDGVDAIVADAIVAPPGSEAEFAERVLRLPRCYQVNDDRRPLPPAPARSEVGLPDAALVLACFNQTYKLTQPFFDAWLDVLREHDDAVLWLAVPHALARRNLLAAAAGAGVAAGRIVFAPIVGQAAHVARLRCADLALDVLPYGSHTTGSDALWAGVPLATCVGGTFAGRVGASLCDAVGLPELAASSLPAYASLVRALAADRARLARCRDHLSSQRARLPLFDTAGFTRDFERLLEGAANGVL